MATKAPLVSATLALLVAAGCDPAHYVFGTVALPPGADVGSVVVQGYEVGGIDDAGLPRDDAGLRFHFLLREDELSLLETSDGTVSFTYGMMGYAEEAEFIAWVWQQPQEPVLYVTSAMRPQAGDHLLSGGGVLHTGSDPRGPGLAFAPGTELDASVGPKTVLDLAMHVRSAGESRGAESPVTYRVFPADCTSSCEPVRVAEGPYGQWTHVVLDAPATPARVEASVSFEGRTVTTSQDVSYRTGDATIGGYARVRLETGVD